MAGAVVETGKMIDLMMEVLGPHGWEASKDPVDWPLIFKHDLGVSPGLR
jgi:hypothetical protein